MLYIQNVCNFSTGISSSRSPGLRLCISMLLMVCLYIAHTPSVYNTYTVTWLKQNACMCLLTLHVLFLCSMTLTILLCFAQKTIELKPIFSKALEGKLLR